MAHGRVLVFLAGLALGWLQTRATCTRRFRRKLRVLERSLATSAALSASSSPSALAPLLLGSLPAWVKFPDYEKAEWLNYAWREMWPLMWEDTCSFLKARFEELMEQHRPPLLSSLTFARFDVGTEPPLVTGIKYHRTGDLGVMYDVDMKWVGDQSVSLRVRRGSLSLTVGVCDIQFQGLVRVVLKPLMPVKPFLGAISFSFMHPPNIDFDLVGVTDSFPLLEETIRAHIIDQLSAHFLWPKAFNLKFQVSEVKDLSLPSGILTLNLDGASGVRKRRSSLMILSALGRSTLDAYVVVKLNRRTDNNNNSNNDGNRHNNRHKSGRQRRESSVLKLTESEPISDSLLAAEWPKRECFRFVVDDIREQAVRLKLYSKSSYRSDTLIGTCDADIASLLAGDCEDTTPIHPFELDITDPTQEDDDDIDNDENDIGSVGRIHGSCSFAPFKDIPTTTTQEAQQANNNPNMPNTPNTPNNDNGEEATTTAHDHAHDDAVNKVGALFVKFDKANIEPGSASTVCCRLRVCGRGGGNERVDDDVGDAKRVGSEWRKTSSVKATAEPAWLEEFTFILDGLTSPLEVCVIDTSFFGGGAILGTALIPLHHLAHHADGRVIQENFPFTDHRPGSINLAMRWLST